MSSKARNIVASAAVMAISVFWYVEAGSFRSLSALFPRVVAVILFVLAVILLILTLLGLGPTIRTADGDTTQRRLRSATLIAALIVWTSLIPLIGLLAASVVGVLFLGVVTFRAHVGTIRAVTVATISVVVFYLLFRILLHVPFPMGLLG